MYEERIQSTAMDKISTEITDPRLALRWIEPMSTIRHASYFLRVQTCSPIVQINNTSLSETGMFYIYI